MIDIKKSVDCCGCNACGDVCPKDAINYKVDIEGFWYPKVDLQKCIDCGLCDGVCPIINVDVLKKNDYLKPECFAAINNNLEVRFDSTSGGLFSVFADKTYRAKGFVGGALFNSSFLVEHSISDDKNDLEALRSSKYLQSDLKGFYRSVKNKLITGRQVLVCGTPCQMAALRAYLRKDYENLIILDFICRGINSPKVFRKYLDYLEARFNSKVIYFKAKNKELGWRELTSKVVFANKKVLYDNKETSYFTKGYLYTGVYCRPSCYECKFKGFPRIADITLADFWGAELTVGKEFDNDLGTSLVLVNSLKGTKFYESVGSTILSKQISLDAVLPGNFALTKSLNLPVVDRDAFYKDLNIIPFEEVAQKYIEVSNSKVSSKRKIKNLLGFIFNVCRVSRLSMPTVYKNLKYNLFCKNVINDILDKKYILINKHSIIEFKPKSKILINGVFEIGAKKFRNSKLETRLLVENYAKLQVADTMSIGYGSDIEVFENAELYFNGKGATNINTTIICAEFISFGERVMIGRNVTIRDNNGGHYISRRGYKNSRQVHIGDHVWLCEGSTVLPGAKIGTGAIIGANSLAVSFIPSFSLASGNPAIVVDEDIYWKY